MNNRFNLIKRSLKEIFLSSTIHGIPNILRAKHLTVQIIWLVCFIVSICSCSYFIIANILEFLEYRALTTMKVISERKIEFPTISFCTYPELEKSIDEIVIQVRFDNIKQTNYLEYFEQFNDTIYGKCFRYNSGFNNNFTYQRLESSTSGLTNGLKLELDLKVNDNDKHDFYEVITFIHNYTLPPFDLTHLGFWLSTGSNNFFQIEREFNEKLEAPYNQCLKDVNTFEFNKTIINYIINSNRSYRQIDCFYLCDNYFALKESKCGCNSTLDRFERNCLKQRFTPIETDMHRCILEYLKLFRSKLEIFKCSDYCPIICDSLDFKINNFPEQFPSAGLISNLTKNEYAYLSRYSTYEQVSKQYIGIRVYYKDLKYIHISQEPKIEVFILVSNIGGILGLFLGISFLSFIEIIEVLSETFLYKQMLFSCSV